MKKPPRTRLRLARETLRSLHAHELRRADGGGAIPVSVLDICPPPPITGDSKRECCV
jgi:hypothetical protein